ncbi:MAG: restriction endonuclease subunit S [Ignavibacteriales bacterium]|nr:MAG: restriction endonuclease subunit S [Ignavibacteriales bacterium]
MNKMTTAEETNKTAWLGEFPPHWQVLRIKNLFREIDNRSESGAEELLSVSHYTGVTLKRESLENEDDHLTNAESLEGYKLVEPGDLVVNIMLAWNGSMGISPYKGITSPAYCVYRIREGNNPEYFGYLFTTALFKAEFRRNSTGIIDSRLRLYSDKFFSIFTVVPPKEEQDKIVEFIKAKEEKINLFIEKKKRLIELLKEQRQRVIDELLKINAETIRLKFCVTKVGSGITPRGGAEVYQDEGVIFLRSQNIHNEGLRLESVSFISEEINADMENSQVRFNDVLINLTGASIGRCQIYNFDAPANVNQHVCIIRPIPDVINSEFLMLQIQSDRIQTLINTVEGASREGLTIDEIKNFVLFIPPIDEQKIIISLIKNETTSIDITIAKAEREIELVREYKEAMIVEAVMGKGKEIKWT